MYTIRITTSYKNIFINVSYKNKDILVLSLGRAIQKTGLKKEIEPITVNVVMDHLLKFLKKKKVVNVILRFNSVSDKVDTIKFVEILSDRFNVISFVEETRSSFGKSPRRPSRPRK